MSITDKTRKALWAKSGNQCAICKQQLIQSKEKQNTIIGQECHIISSKPNGPRHRNISQYDDEENLILLCANHHELIDKNVEKYTEALLKKIKANHESFVSRKLLENKKIEEKDTLILLRKSENVRDVVRILHEAEYYATDYPVEKKNDYELFNSFISMVNNSDILHDYDEFTRMSYFEEDYNELIKRGYYILIGFSENFGNCTRKTAYVYIVIPEQFEKKAIKFKDVMEQIDDK